MLEGLGLKDTNGDGIREFTEGPLAGQDVVIGLEAGEDNTAGASLGQAIVAFLQDVGIKVNFRTIAGTAGTDNESGRHMGDADHRVRLEAWARRTSAATRLHRCRTDFGLASPG